MNPQRWWISTEFCQDVFPLSWVLLTCAHLWHRGPQFLGLISHNTQSVSPLFETQSGDSTQKHSTKLPTDPYSKANQHNNRRSVGERKKRRTEGQNHLTTSITFVHALTLKTHQVAPGPFIRGRKRERRSISFMKFTLHVLYL